MSSSPRRTSMMNPYEQQQKLIKCLTTSRQQQQQQPNTTTDVDADTDIIKSNTSRKRPRNSTGTSSTATKVISEMSTKSNTDQSNANNNNTIDEHKVWQDISTFLSLLTYGEESIDLLNSLLCLPFGMIEGVEDCIDSLDCNNKLLSVEDVHKRKLSAKDAYKQKEAKLSYLGRVLNNMLHVRSIMRGRGSSCMQQQQVAAATKSPHSKKKQRIIKEEKSSQSPAKSTAAAVANKKDIDILPWNVLLRITIRMTAHVVKQLNSYDTSAANGIKQDDEQVGERGEASVHPLLQVLDIVSGSLHLLTRMQKQKQSQLNETTTTASGKNTKITTPTKKKRASAQPPSSQSTNNKAQLPKDRMIYDWKSNNNKLKTSPSRLSPTGREIWGPSRYTFLKDIDSITQLLKVDKDAVSIMGINHDEWYERINSIVQALDECVRVEQRLQFGNDVSPIRHEDGVGEQLQQSATLGISPSLLRYGTKSSIKSRPPMSPSLASITKAHVERMSAQKKADRESCKKKLAFASSKSVDEQVSGGVSVNLQAMMDKESHNPVKMEEGAEEDEKDSELVDAYRMAIIFGSTGNGSEQDTARETIERRLTILVQKVNTMEEKQQQVKGSDSLNVDGALSYLETLLCTLIKPQDSNVWFKLLSKSDGKDTPIMLRRGRASLVSFLIEIKSPGWQEADNQLISSPVPSYLGYLSCSEDAVQPPSKGKGQQEIHHRSSYFLPAVETGETILPPSPVVTEVGLSLCIKNFLHKDTPTGSISSQQPSSKRSPGVCIFKNYEPIQTSSSTNVSDDILNSIETTPLSDVNELTRDIFDLILRLAADDDVDHENKPFPLRLTTSSPSESLNIVLNVVSEHLDWLSPHSIMARYRFVLQHMMKSFSSEIVPSDLVDDDEGGGGIKAWSKRASFLIDATKTSSQGQMALYTTQFMLLLCLRGKGNTHKSSFPGSTKQPHFYTCLQLRQSSQFWNEIDKSVDDYSSNIMTRVLDKEFALQLLLPLSHQCALLLASSTPSLSRINMSTSSHGQDTQSMQSLITILTSVLDVVADNGHLQECIHMGWAFQMLALTVNHFIFSGVEGESNNSVWEDISRQLNRLYFSVWGEDWQSLSQTNKSNQDYIVYEAIDHDHTGTRMVVLMPSLDVFVVSLIKFVCNLKVESNEDMKRFCAFVAHVMFDRYEHAVRSISNSSKDAPRVEHKWIALLASTLQDVCSKKPSHESVGRNRADKADDDDKTTEQALADLITPALECLHMLIMQRVLRTNSSRQEMSNQQLEPVASVYVALHQQESEKFIKKPSSAKTRRWGVYRQCLEQVFTLTPTSVLFVCHGNPALTEHSANVLKTIWNQYGQCELSHSISIMVGAALHVNASAVCLRSDSPSSMGRKDDSSQHLKQLYSTFSSQAKDCIVNTFQCFKAEQKTKHQLRDDSQTDINGLIRFVRIELSHHSEAEVGLSWWNEVSSDLLSVLAKSKQQANELDDKKKNAASKNIKRKSSTLRNKLSAISSG